MPRGSGLGPLSTQKSRGPPSPRGRLLSEAAWSWTEACGEPAPWSPQPCGVSLPLPSPWQSSYPIWEDFNSKATKLHSQLR